MGWRGKHSLLWQDLSSVPALTPGRSQPPSSGNLTRLASASTCTHVHTHTQNYIVRKRVHKDYLFVEDSLCDERAAHRIYTVELVSVLRLA